MILTARFNASAGGAPTDVDNLTVTVIAMSSGDTVLAATGVGILRLATGFYRYEWDESTTPAGLYLARWDGTYGGNAVDASEEIAVAAQVTNTSSGPDVWYCTREDVKRALDVKEIARTNTQIDREIAASSRNIEGLLHRVFYPTIATRKFDWPSLPTTGAYPWRLWLGTDEVIEVYRLTSGGIEIPEGGYLLEPVNLGPPFDHIDINLASNSAFSAGATWQQSIEGYGLFGYDNRSALVGALAAAVTDATSTRINLTDSAAVGVGSILLVDAERMLVTGRSMLDTGQVTQSDLGVLASVVTVPVTDGTAYEVDEVILIDAERMLIVDIAGNNLIVKRSWDGTVLAAHTIHATIYAPRTLTVARGALGTAASAHLDAAPVMVQLIPAGVRELCIAETIVTLERETSGYSRTVGGGDTARNASLVDIADVRAKAMATYRRLRTGAI